MNKIIIKGARENNLKNVNIEIPKNKFVVMTGISGSGKSSLAFDTIYAEGQRRYVESLSAYARQFLGGTEKPDVDSIEGLSPAISIDQKTTNKNPRSTVGTITEIYDYLRLLYARIGVPYCPKHNIPISSQSVEEMVNKVLEIEEGKKIRIIAPVANGEKGTHQKLLDNLRKEGFARVRINGEERDLSEKIELSKNTKDNIDIIIDRLIVKKEIRGRLFESIELATNKAEGKVIVDIVGGKEILMSEKFACPFCEFSLPELEPRMFSFNSPFGACLECNGLGVKLSVDVNMVIPNDKLSINQFAIATLGEDKENIYFKRLSVACRHFKIDMDKSFKDLTKKEKKIILYGTDKEIEFELITKSGNKYKYNRKFEGVISNLERRYIETNSEYIREWIKKYMIESTCDSCKGKRLNEGILSVLVKDKNIAELTNMSVRNLKIFFDDIRLNKVDKKISELIIKEIKDRLLFLVNVGLDYLSLDRSSGTLSGGEAQRIRLATQIGSRLTGVLYVLDEPSIGLHQKDNEKLIKSLLEMRDLGNSLIVVEHDSDTMLASDYLIDIGPGAGLAGGEIVAFGTPKEVMENNESITGKYLSGKMSIDVPEKRRRGTGKYLKIKEATQNNLKSINVDIPLGTLTLVTGVSGSGKSSLINEILYKKIASNLYKSKIKVGDHKEIKGLELIDKIVEISQDPIGRTPRSNPATYIGLFDNIRGVYASTKEAKIRGYSKGRFSFNVRGGRCEACRGDGVRKIEMHFLPDVYVPCEVCSGKRYNSETLEIKYKGKSISDVLDMRVEEAIGFFENIPKVKKQLQILIDVGLGYIKLGQQATTLSGGEAGRIKLAKELQKKPTGKTLFILDEPTTGLHAHDVKKLLVILNRIVDHGDTVVVIEHNLDVIKQADYVIDLGPGGGDFGGSVIASGTPEEVILIEGSYTGQYLKKLLKPLL